MPDTPTTFDPANLEGLLFVARRLVEGLYTGRHLSPIPGAGQDYYDYRAYVPGDDLKHVDWKLVGRTDRYYVRRYRRLSDVDITLLVDVSASMGFNGLSRQGWSLPHTPARGGSPSKLNVAALLAATIAQLAIRQGDRAGLTLIADHVIDHLPPAGTTLHMQEIAARLEGVAPVTPAGRQPQRGISEALRAAHALMRRRGLVVLISDLLDDTGPLFDGLDRLRHDGFEVIVFQVLHPQEVSLQGIDHLRATVIDPERRRGRHANLSRVARRYRELIAHHVNTLHDTCMARQVDHELITTDTPLLNALRRFLARRAGA